MWWRRNRVGELEGALWKEWSWVGPPAEYTVLGVQTGAVACAVERNWDEDKVVITGRLFVGYQQGGGRTRGLNREWGRRDKKWESGGGPPSLGLAQMKP